MKFVNGVLVCGLLSLSMSALAGSTTDAAIGGAVGGAVGAAVGNEVGGREGAIVGGGDRCRHRHRHPHPRGCEAGWPS